MRAAAPVMAGAMLMCLAIGGIYVYRSQSVAADAALVEAEAQMQEAGELADRTTELERDLASEKRRVQQAEADAAEARKELAAANAKVASLTEELAAATAPAEAPGATDTGYPAFRPEGVAEALADVDWEVIATSMSNMPPLIDELAAALADGRPQNELPAETIGAIQRHNGPLVAAGMKLAQAKVAGEAVNSAFTHPGFMSNAMAATLDAVELPLSDEQRAALERITLDYSTRESRRLEAYDDSTYALEKFVDESALKGAYFAEVYRVLTDEQHDTIRPESVRGRTQLDIFGHSLLWSGRAGPLVVNGRDDLAGHVGRWIGRRAGIAEDLRPRAMELIEAWVADLPDAFIARQSDALVASGMMHVEHVEESGAHVLELLRTFDTELDLDDAGRTRLRAVPGTVVIYTAATSDDG